MSSNIMEDVDGASIGLQPSYLARAGVEQVVHKVLTAARGNEAVADLPIGPGWSSTTMKPTNLVDATEVARILRETAYRLMERYARDARGAGSSWGDLVDALGVESPEAAFELVAGDPGNPWDQRRTHWRCDTCEQSITDVGPYNSNPYDDEAGHNLDCARHLADVAALGLDPDDDSE